MKRIREGKMQHRKCFILFHHIELFDSRNWVWSDYFKLRIVILLLNVDLLFDWQRCDHCEICVKKYVDYCRQTLERNRFYRVLLSVQYIEKVAFPMGSYGRFLYKAATSFAKSLISILSMYFSKKMLDVAII